MVVWLITKSSIFKGVKGSSQLPDPNWTLIGWHDLWNRFSQAVAFDDALIFFPLHSNSLSILFSESLLSSAIIPYIQSVITTRSTSKVRKSNRYGIVPTLNSVQIKLYSKIVWFAMAQRMLAVSTNLWWTSLKAWLNIWISLYICVTFAKRNISFSAACLSITVFWSLNLLYFPSYRFRKNCIHATYGIITPNTMKADEWMAQDHMKKFAKVNPILIRNCKMFPCEEKVVHSWSTQYPEFDAMQGRNQTTVNV